jgi:NAD(P)-dependent dehydrogenase (short-subunit alcohol dehydrogenase family)
MTDLKGKTALVTGSTSGIGRATALALAAWGAHVLVVGRSKDRAAGVIAEIERDGGSATAHLTTLDAASARELAAWATEAGGGHVDILINNAGVSVLGPAELATGHRHRLAGGDDGSALRARSWSAASPVADQSGAVCGDDELSAVAGAQLGEQPAACCRLVGAASLSATARSAA